MADFQLSSWIASGNEEYDEITGAKSYSKVTMVYAIITKIARSVAGIPLVIKNPSGAVLDIAKDREDPVSKLFNPPWGEAIPTESDLREGISVFGTIDGDAFIVPDEFVNEKPINLKLLPGSLVQNEKDNKTGVKFWYTGGGDNKQIFNPGEIFQFKYSVDDKDITRGLSPLLASRRSIELNVYSDAINASIMKTGDVPSAIIEYPEGNLTKEQRDQMQANYKKYRQGLEKKAGLFIVEGGGRYIQTKLSAKDISYVQGKEKSIEEIASALGCTPAKAGIFQYANYANSDAQDRFFYSDTVLPLLRKIQSLYQQILDKFFPGYSVEFDLSDITPLILNLTEKSKVAQAFFTMGVPFNAINQVMRLGFPYIDGGDIGYINGMPATFYSTKGITAIEGFIRGRKLITGRPLFAMLLPRDGSQEKIDTSEEFFDLYRANLQANVYIPFTKKIKSFYQDYFDTLAKIVIKQVREAEADGSLAAYRINSERWGNIYSELLFPTAEQISAVALYYLVGENSSKNLLPAYARCIKAELPDVTLSQFLSPAQIQKLRTTIGAVLDNASLTVTQTYADQINAVIQNGLEEKLSITDIAHNILLATDQRVANALTNAQTLVTSAYNSARIEGMEAYQINFHLWVSSRDGVVRPSHRREDSGKPIRVGEPFPETGLLYPGDPNGAPEQVINCRCTTVSFTPSAMGRFTPNNE